MRIPIRSMTGRVWPLTAPLSQCPLRSESDRSAALPQSVAMCQQATYAVQQNCPSIASLTRASANWAADCHAGSFENFWTRIRNKAVAVGHFHAWQGLRVEHGGFVDDLSFAEDVGAHGVDFVGRQRAGRRRRM